MCIEACEFLESLAIIFSSDKSQVTSAQSMVETPEPE